MKSCEILWIYEIQQISVQIWCTSGAFQMMQISFRFTADFITDFICRFQCGLLYGFHLCILCISYEIHLILNERPGESEESRLNQLLLLILGGFHWNLLDFMWNPPDFKKTGGFHVNSLNKIPRISITKNHLPGMVTPMFSRGYDGYKGYW